MKNWLVFDCETTGLIVPNETNLDKQPRIIELALIEVIAGTPTRETSWLINPGVPITEEITKITGLKDSDVADKPKFAELLPEITSWFLGRHGLVAHNLPFDRGMMVLELQRLGREHAFPYPPEQLCTVQAFQYMAGRRMKLTELFERVMGKPLAQTHRALDDTRALVDILIKEQVLI